MRHITTVISVALATGLSLPVSVANGEDQSRRTTKIEFYAAYEEPGDGLSKKIAPSAPGREEMTIYLAREPAITNADIEQIKTSTNETGLPVIALKLSESGGTKMQKLSKLQFGKLIAIVINGEVVIAPKVKSEMNRDLVISGLFTEEWVNETVSKFGQP